MKHEKMGSPAINPNALACSLQKALQELGVPIKLGTAQEAVAKLSGTTNWRTLAALRKHGRLEAASAEHEQILKPRVLVHLNNRDLTYASDEGVDLHILVNGEMWLDPDEDPDIAPERFQDLADQIGAPVDRGVLDLKDSPEAVREAFEHVASRFPGITHVHYDWQGRWYYAYRNGSGPTLSHGSGPEDVDTGLLEDAADAVAATPVTYRLSDEALPRSEDPRNRQPKDFTLEEKRLAVKKAGYTVVEQLETGGWYALLPGYTSFFDDGEGLQNYRGFVDSEEELLDEILEEVLPDPDRYADDLSHFARWHRQM